MLIFSSAYADEQLDFKGIYLGTDLAVIQADTRFHCVPSKKPTLADTICSLKPNETETIAGSPVKFLMLLFYKDKLAVISISFREKYFNDVSSALTEKYGKGEEAESVVVNRMGVSFKNKNISWRKGASFLIAERYAGTLDTSSIQFKTDDSVMEFQRRKGASSIDRSKDL